MQGVAGRPDRHQTQLQPHTTSAGTEGRWDYAGTICGLFLPWLCSAYPRTSLWACFSTPWSSQLTFRSINQPSDPSHRFENATDAIMPFSGCDPLPDSVRERPLSRRSHVFPIDLTHLLCGRVYNCALLAYVTVSLWWSLLP